MADLPFSVLTVVDVGVAQLATYSSYETCGSKDIDYMIGFMSEFYSSAITVDDNRFIVNG